MFQDCVRNGQKKVELRRRAGRIPYGALTRLCLLHYVVDEKTTVTKLPQPDARQQAILAALGVTLPAM
jgi:hypothetical protein